MAERLWSEIEHIYIEREAQYSEVAQRAQQLFAPEKISIVDSEPHAGDRGELTAKQFDRSKKELFITNFKGQFFKRCPGSRPGLTCCNYFVLNLGQQCNMNCSYCYLQSFLNSPVMKVYANIDQALEELQSMATEQVGDHRRAFDLLRVGTGEVIDSLSLDPLTLYSRKLISFFKQYPNWRLEFKTKSSQVDQFLDVEHAGNVIVSFSVNPQNIIEREEHGTASLEARLLAAQKARAKGFQISFHIDPMIYHPEWRESYASLVEAITSHFRPEDVPIMSVGALRFQPEQRHMMRDRFGLKSLVMQAEVFQSSDGKLRYDQALRQEMLNFMLEKFKVKSQGLQTPWRLFLCMETPETWLKAVGSMPKNVDGLGDYFDHRILQQVRNLSAT